MNRREWVLGTSGVAAGLGLAGLAMPAWAQGGPVEGRDFKRVAQPVAVGQPEGKVDVVEFFGYWCPHCHAFEPALDAWVRKLPAQVQFRRMPVAFNAAQEPLQRLYFALDALGLVDSLHRKVFTALHVERKRLNNEADIGAWVQSVGADSTKVLDAMKSFTSATRSRQSRQLSEGFGIEGVPTLGIQGRWMTSPGLAGSPERALAVVDALVAQVKKA